MHASFVLCILHRGNIEIALGNKDTGTWSANGLAERQREREKKNYHECQVKLKE